MIEYRVITYNIHAHRDGVDDLAELVNQAIREGWQPLGGVSIANEGPHAYHGITQAQAMIREHGPDS